MARILYPRRGQTVYISSSDIFVSQYGVPCTHKSFYEAQGEVLSEPVAVYRNPQTNELEVHLPVGHKAWENPNTSIDPSDFTRLTLITPDGKRYSRDLPTKYIDPWK